MLALGLAWLVTLIWGSSFILIKLGLEDLTPLFFAALRYWLGGVLLYLFLGARREPLFPTLPRRTWGIVVLSGLATYTAGQGLFYTGQTYVSALTGSFFYSLAPLFVLLLGLIHLGRRPGWLQLAGLVVTLVGSGIFFPPAVALEQWPGVVLMIASNVATGYYLILMRTLREQTKLGAIWLTGTALFTGGGLLFAPAFVFEGLPTLTPRAIVIILWLATVNTALAYTIWNTLLKTVPPFELSVLGNIIPLQTALIGWLLFHQHYRLQQILGLVIVLAGVSLVQLDAAVLQRRLAMAQAK
ncbi:MAG: EamA family transporter [Deinococcus sp.]|nr:EamA family transporter [Deinococcus sp.]